LLAALAEHHRVVAPDLLGFGQSAKVIDFVDGRGMRIRHLAGFCAALGISSAHFVGNSMGAIMLLTGATSGAQHGDHLRRRTDPAQPLHGRVV
jgi:2-hydroxymuconate-semialdehyde hydrolase